MNKPNKIKNVGFLLPKLDNETHTQKIVYEISSYIYNNPKDHIVIFSSYNKIIDNYNVPILHINESKFFFGDLFIMDLPSVILSNKYPNISKRYFYTNSIPWEKNPNFLYTEWLGVYDSNNINIIVSDERLFNIYNICWKKPINIMETFNHDKLAQII
jgi:hypothetical protein